MTSCKDREAVRTLVRFLTYQMHIKHMSADGFTRKNLRRHNGLCLQSLAILQSLAVQEC